MCDEAERLRLLFEAVARPESGADRGPPGGARGDAFEFGGKPPFLDAQVVGRLVPQPEFRCGAKVAPEAQGCIHREGGFPAHEAFDARARHMERCAETIRDQAERLKELFPQDFARMYGGEGLAFIGRHGARPQ